MGSIASAMYNSINNTRYSLMPASGLLIRRHTMKLTASLNKKIRLAVQTSMQIEGYKPTQSPAIKDQVKALMEQHRVQVSVPRK